MVIRWWRRGRGDRCECGAHLRTVWNFATCPVCEKLALRKRVEWLEAELERADKIREADLAFYKLTVAQRDLAWRQLEWCGKDNAELLGKLGARDER